MAAGVRLIADGPYHSRNETEEFDVVSAVVMTLDADLARQIISPSLSQSDLRFSNQLPPEDRTFAYGTGMPATRPVNHRVQLLTDGSLHGIANCIGPGTGRLRESDDVTVYFVREGRMIVGTRVELSGTMMVSGLSPGVYRVIGSGTDGNSAIALESVGPDEDRIARQRFDVNIRNDLNDLDARVVSSVGADGRSECPPRWAI